MSNARDWAGGFPRRTKWTHGSVLGVYDHARPLVPVVLPLTAPILDRARSLLDRYPDLVARDAVHAAVALEHTGGRICSVDDDFDAIEEITRTRPG